MKKEKNNFTRAVEWLYDHGKIKSHKEMAERMGTSPTTISRNKHGGVKHPDEDTLRKFNNVFGDIINIGFLRGESDVMLVKDLQLINQDANNDLHESTSVGNEQSILVNAVIAAKEETIAALRDQLADKDALIKVLQQQLTDLRTQLAVEKGLLTGTSPSAPAEPKPRPCKSV